MAEAHPRACGENATRALEPCMGKGSSPRVRGKRHDFPVSGFASRLIPARAGKTRPLQRGRQRHGAHPRACGENLLDGDPPPPTTGSSPRVRGKPHLVQFDLGDGGLIPARAGKTDGGPAAGGGPGAHPRACGENSASKSRTRWPPGSSPRVRGKRPGLQRHPARWRLIPARAGKTRSASRSPPTWRAHPRACGENVAQIRRYMEAKGSSPRVRGKRRGPRPVRVPRPAHPRACGENLMSHQSFGARPGSSPRVRGKPAVTGEPAQVTGLIPARAGKTEARTVAYIRFGAHPRACGENERLETRVAQRPGSSPRVRGKLARAGDVGEVARLIPARAGKTGRGAGRTKGSTAHPRACGENLEELVAAAVSVGSSPRVRGKPSMKSAAILAHGLIPARAGKTALRRWYRSAPTAHPRACGENYPTVIVTVPRQGSSPRVRGKRGGDDALAAAPGLIPARAGKTWPGASRSRPPRAHPRACGENRGERFADRRCDGSSPRVRGKRGRGTRRVGRSGLIPARAGKTVGVLAVRGSAEAHPRACGENPSHG